MIESFTEMKRLRRPMCNYSGKFEEVNHGEASRQEGALCDARDFPLSQMLVLVLGGSIRRGEGFITAAINKLQAKACLWRQPPKATALASSMRAWPRTSSISLAALGQTLLTTSRCPGFRRLRCGGGRGRHSLAERLCRRAGSRSRLWRPSPDRHSCAGQQTDRGQERFGERILTRGSLLMCFCCRAPLNCLRTLRQLESGMANLMIERSNPAISRPMVNNLDAAPFGGLNMSLDFFTVTKRTMGRDPRVATADTHNHF